MFYHHLFDVVQLYSQTFHFGVFLELTVLYATELNTGFYVGQLNRPTKSASPHLYGSLCEASLFFLVPSSVTQRGARE